MNRTIIASWEKNADEWIRIIDTDKIASREFTNEAIVEVINRSAAHKVLDIGCGEGWLTRSITKMGKVAVGVDVIEKLLENAQEKGSEHYYRISYEDISKGKPIPEGPYEMAVFNFSIYQNEGVVALLENVQKALKNGGQIVIQTLHPYFLIENGLLYKSQVIENAWKGLPGHFTEGHSWYARTFEEWVSVFLNCNLRLIRLKEVKNKYSNPVSMIFILEKIE